MALSAQLVSALAGVLLAVPFYFLTRRVLDANTAFAAGLLFAPCPGAWRSRATASRTGCTC